MAEDFVTFDDDVPICHDFSTPEAVADGILTEMDEQLTAENEEPDVQLDELDCSFPSVADMNEYVWQMKRLEKFAKKRGLEEADIFSNVKRRRVKDL